MSRHTYTLSYAKSKTSWLAKASHLDSAQDIAQYWNGGYPILWRRCYKPQTHYIGYTGEYDYPTFKITREPNR